MNVAAFVPNLMDQSRFSAGTTPFELATIGTTVWTDAQVDLLLHHITQHLVDRAVLFKLVEHGLYDRTGLLIRFYR